MAQQEKDADKTSKANKAKKNGNGEEVEDPEQKEAQRSQISYTAVIAGGTVFRQTIAGTDLLDSQIGAIISVFREFARWPYIGGFSNKGFGQVNVDFTLRVRGGNTLTRFGVKDGKFFQENGEQYLAAWDKYLDGITCLDDIRIPEVKKEESEEKDKPAKKPKGGVKRGPAATEQETAAPAEA